MMPPYSYAFRTLYIKFCNEDVLPLFLSLAHVMGEAINLRDPTFRAALRSDVVRHFVYQLITCY